MRSRVSGLSDLLAPPSWGDLMRSQGSLTPAVPPSNALYGCGFCNHGGWQDEYSLSSRSLAWTSRRAPLAFMDTSYLAFVDRI
jgi:hypothetical protein